MTVISWDGHYACQCVIGFTADVERRLGKKLYVYQGSYSTGVSQSGGTHSGGGAIDFATYDDNAIRVMRECGGAAWHRTPAQGFRHHGHVIVLGCPHVSPAARDQQVQYQQGRNGLRYRGPDDGPRVSYITWADAHNRSTARPAANPASEPAAGTAYVSVLWVNAARAAKGRYTSRHVAVVQTWLHKIGFYNAAIDGRWGPVTQGAFDAFRRSLGWGPTDSTGSAGITSLTRLRASAGGGPSVKAK